MCLPRSNRPASTMIALARFVPALTTSSVHFAHALPAYPQNRCAEFDLHCCPSRIVARDACPDFSDFYPPPAGIWHVRWLIAYRATRPGFGGVETTRRGRRFCTYSRVRTTVARRNRARSFAVCPTRRSGIDESAPIRSLHRRLATLGHRRALFKGVLAMIAVTARSGLPAGVTLRGPALAAPRIRSALKTAV